MAYNILVVDDSRTMRMVIIKTLKACGFQVGQFFEASNGNEAMEILGKDWVDLVIADHNMPDMDGLALLSEMKKDEILQAIPVVMITTEGSQERIKEFMEKGAADYIKKPFSPETIRDKLRLIKGVTQAGDGRDENGDDGFDF
ncbi:response regulator [Desulfobacula sp.]|uniref:response regulator n=1 Tax=Desulfobacula sp. TaxID=2593537 RepID=UPI001EBF97C4|nr:response regulator [Desulfobacula sp.]